jgi:hypothetical protein
MRALMRAAIDHVLAEVWAGTIVSSASFQNEPDAANGVNELELRFAVDFAP